MSDTFSPSQRSELMARIRSKNTGPERAVRSILSAHGFRFRLHRAGLPGTPDIVMSKRRIAIFVHGCFWHSHSCQKGRKPGTNKTYWNAKLERNVQRDATNARELKSLGWKRIVVWGCELRNVVRLERRIVRLLATGH